MVAEHRLKSGRHLDKLLTALQVRNFSEPGRYPDGNGLFLIVAQTGGKRWMLRTVVNGRRRDIGLGGLSYVSLAEAREKAYALRKIAREGGDPLADRQRKKEASLTFSAAAQRVHAEQKAGWKNPKHAQQWINTVAQYAVPIIGDLPVDRIGTPEVMKVLSPIWLSDCGPPTASNEVPLLQSPAQQLVA